MPSGAGGEYLGEAVLKLSTDDSKYAAGVSQPRKRLKAWRLVSRKPVLLFLVSDSPSL